MAQEFVTANDNNLSFAKIEEILKKSVVHEACGLKAKISTMPFGDVEKVCDGICPKCGGLFPEVK